MPQETFGGAKRSSATQLVPFQDNWILGLKANPNF